MSRSATVALGAVAFGLVGVAVGFTRLERRAAPVSVPAAEVSLLGVPSSVVLADGTALNLDLSAPVPVAGDVVRLDADLFLALPAAPTRSLIFTFDVSASTLDPGGSCGGDFNGDGRSDTILDCQLGAMSATLDDLAATGTFGDVGFAIFAGNARTVDVGPAAGTQLFTDDIADLQVVLENVIRLRADEFTRVVVLTGTRFAPALSTTCGMLASTPYPATVLFLSDGEGTGPTPVEAVLPCAEPAVIHTFAVGAGASCDTGAAAFGSLGEIAALTGGTCTEVASADSLGEVLAAGLRPAITALTLSIDGGAPIDVSDSLDLPLPHEGDAVVHFSREVAAEHTLCLTATAVLDGVASEVTECVAVATNEPPIADAGPDSAVDEGTLATLDGSASADPDGDALSYAWSLVGIDGPPLVIPGSALPSTVVRTLDDGTYTFELTVSDGELSATDAVTVTVGNVAPAATAVLDGAAVGGVALLTASFTDPGVIDAHGAVVDWGDGSVEEISVSAQGTGWGSLYAAHTYAAPGAYAVQVAVDDDDGGTATVALPIEEIPVPLALFATTGGIDWTGGAGAVTGRVHSNGSLRIHGAGKSLVGGASYATTASIGQNIAVDPPAVLGAWEVSPVLYDLADYRPGGRAAVAAGADFHEVGCTNGRWDVHGTLAPGLYYAPCDVQLLAPQSEATIVSDGHIQVASQGSNLRPFSDGLLLGAASIQISASGGTYLGHLVATGTVDLSGAANRYLCGIVGGAIDLTGAAIAIEGSDCVRPDRTTAPPTLVPTLTVSLANDVASPLPSEPVSSTLTLANDGALLLVPGIVGLQNHGETPVVVTSASVVLEALRDGAWTPLPAALSLSGAPFVGTVVDPGETATWGAELQLALDAPLAGPVRTNVSFEVDDPLAPVRSLYRFGDVLDLPDGTVSAIEATLTTVDGATRVAPVGDLAPGEVAVVAASGPALAAAPIGSETPAAYLARLHALDGAGLAAIGSARGTGGVGIVLGPQVIAASTLAVPVVEADFAVPAAAVAGETLEIPFDLANTSTADASVTLPVAVELPSGALSGGALEVPVAPLIFGESSWLDARGSLYGPVREAFAVTLVSPSALQASLSDVLYVNADADAVVTPGDTIRYVATVTNAGAAAIGGVHLDLPLNPATSLVAGDPSTDLGTLAGFASAQVVLDARIDDPLAAVLTVQGTVTSALPTVLTNEAITPVATAAPVLFAELTAALVRDADLTGGPSVGDTLRYTAILVNPGLTAAHDVALDVAPDPLSTLVSGSASTDRGAVVLDAAVLRVEVGTLIGGDGAEISFEVVATSGTLLATQGVVTATGISSFGTDDPAVPGSADPTITLLGTGGVDPNAPVVTLLTPIDGARQGAPTEITASAEGVASWRVLLDEAVVFAGTGALPASLGLFDPTQLQNGLYALRVEVTDEAGRIGSDTAWLEVAGDMKLGAYDLAFLEAEWSAGPTAISLVRSYTTLRKDEVGDFGHGWRLSMTDFVVQPNGALGDGGWTQEICAGHLFFNEICTVSDRPRIVLVRWPDGRVESFDLTPTAGSTFFAPLSTAAYTPRPGATSTLAPAPGDELLVFVGGVLYTDLSARYVYDPRQFVLTDNRGTSYLLDVELGLVEMTDPQGNVTLFTDDGIFPEIGEGVTFDRDGEGRIAAMHLPDGSAVTYTYADGDLVEVIDGEGDAMAFTYAGHLLTAYNVAGQPPIAELVYDADGRLLSAVDDAGVLVETSSFIATYQQVEVGPDPRLTTTTTFDADGQAIEIVQAFEGEQFVTSMTYDEDFWLATRTLPTGATESWTYDEQGRVLVHTDPAGVVRESIYGPDGQVAVSLEGGEIVEETVFANDLPSLVYRGDGTLLRREVYDADGLLLSLENGTGQVLGINWSNGQIDSVVLPDFGGAPDLVDVTFDGRGQLLSATTAAGTTSYTYDANGRQTSITDPLGHVMSFGYDPLGRMTSYTDKRGFTVHYTFDENGRELTRTNRNGETLVRSYDTAGRLATMTGPGVDREFGYDALGRVVYQRDADHVEERSYDPHHLATISTSLATLELGYDPAGRLVDLVTPGMTATHGYDTRGRLASIVEDQLGAFGFAYDDVGRISALNRPNGVTTTYGYNGAGQNTAIDSGVHAIFTAYDDRALPVAQTDQEGVHTYEHDVLGRLVAVDHPGGAAFGDEAYSYDVADRRTSNGAVYDEADRLLEDAEFTYTYDDEGRRTSRTAKVGGALTTYAWNVLDQLVALEEGMIRWEYTYDARDLRVQVRNDAGYDEQFVYDHNGTVRATYDGSGALTASYLTGFGFGEVLARVELAGEAYAVRDRLGSTVAWLAATGELEEHVVRDAYGVRAEAADGVVPFGYTGHAEDPTGLAWGRARYLDAPSSVWTSEDPMVTEPRYCYVGGAPHVASDPTGLSEAVQYGPMARVGGCLGMALAATAGAIYGGEIGALSTGYASSGLGYNPAHEAFGGCVAGALAPGSAGSSQAAAAAAAGGFVGAFMDAVGLLDWMFE